MTKKSKNVKPVEPTGPTREEKAAEKAALKAAMKEKRAEQKRQDEEYDAMVAENIKKLRHGLVKKEYLDLLFKSKYFS